MNPTTCRSSGRAEYGPKKYRSDTPEIWCPVCRRYYEPVADPAGGRLPVLPVHDYQPGTDPGP